MAILSQTMVGMAEIKVLKSQGVLTCLGLGSCIGLIGFDRENGVAGMVHIMLPEAFKDKRNDKPGKFADTGIPALLKEIEKNGGNSQRLIMAYAGGAQVFKYGAETNRTLDVGLRNAEAVNKILMANRSRILAKDTGGTNGRTIMFDLETGNVNVRTVQGGEKTLCNLKGRSIE